jgi:hypothetical protein
MVVVCLVPWIGIFLNRPDEGKPRRFPEREAHAEALTYLAGVMRCSADRAADPSLVRSRIAAVLEISEYPGRGDVSEWESKLSAALYATDDEPSDPWEQALVEYFEFARENLYCGFVKQHNCAAYERVRACLAAIGIEAKPVEELTLGRL